MDQTSWQENEVTDSSCIYTPATGPGGPSKEKVIFVLYTAQSIFFLQNCGYLNLFGIFRLGFYSLQFFKSACIHLSNLNIHVKQHLLDIKNNRLKEKDRQLSTYDIKEIINKTCPCYVYPREPYFYIIAKLGVLLQNIYVGTH